MGPGLTRFLADNPTCARCGQPSEAVALVDDRNIDLDARRYWLAALCGSHHREWALGHVAEQN